MAATTNAVRGDHTHARIKAQGVKREGKILAADNWGQSRHTGEGEDDWYIELEDPTHGYCYWKQKIDGGTFEFYTP